MERVVERGNNCAKMNFLSGGAGEPSVWYLKVYLHSAFLQLVNSGANHYTRSHSGYFGAWMTFQRNCVMLRISAIYRRPQSGIAVLLCRHASVRFHKRHSPRL